MRHGRLLLCTALALTTAAGCASSPPQAVSQAGADTAPASMPELPPFASAESRIARTGARQVPVAPTADALLSGLSHLCGQAFAGEVEADLPASADSPFAGETLVMHVRECGRDAVRVPFHVGEDRSRTWVFTRLPGGLRLKHDHRHSDGSPDALTMYGGDAAAAFASDAGWLRLAFPVDAESVTLFQAEGRTASVRNTWAVELSERRFVYELSRPDGRLFRVVFDLTRPVPVPPAPWGAQSR